MLDIKINIKIYKYVRYLLAYFSLLIVFVDFFFFYSNLLTF